MIARSQAGLIIPNQPMTRIQGRLNQVWRPGLAPHHTIVAQNGAGKTGLITGCLMPLCANDRVLIIDVKGDDPMWQDYGVPVEWVERGFNGDGNGPGRNWYRLVVDMADRDRARKQVGQALDLTLDEGHLILIVDEMRAITDPEELAYRAKLEAVLLRTRSRHVCGILAAQATEWMIPSARNQWSFAWVGKMEDDAVIERTCKLIGISAAAPSVRSLRRGKWLYVDNESDSTMMAVTTSWQKTA